MKGFTLIELLITMILVAVLSTMGLASYTYLIQKNEQQTIIDELKVAVRYAKMQAIISGGSVSLSPVKNWADGMVLTSGNKMEPLYQWQWHHPRWTLIWKGAYSAEKINFSPNPAQAISNGRFILTNTQTNQQTILILNRLGRLRSIA